MGWASNPTRKAEQLFTVSIIQMGARVYIPSLGRFMQVDPIEGGCANGYVYAGDPVNGSDYSGMSIWSNIKKKVTGAYNSAKAYGQYLFGGGKTVKAKITDYSWQKYSIKDFGIAPSDFVNKNGTYGVGGIPRAVVPTPIVAQPKDIAGKAILGQVTISLQGTLTVKDNSWQFHGSFSVVPDTYNFDVGVKRTKTGAFSTGVGAAGGAMAQILSYGIIDPTDYTRIIEGSIPINESGSF